MLYMGKVSPKDIEIFIQSLTTKETEYYDIQNDHIPETFIYANGAWDDDKLVGIGGLAKWYKIFPHPFYMIKESHQGNRLGSRFADLNVAYAKEKGIPFLLGTVKNGNFRSMKIITNRGHEKICIVNGEYYNILVLDKKWGWIKIILRFLLPFYSVGKYIVRGEH